MRHFHSYGPVDPELHYCVPRTELISRCADQLVGSPDKGGHYFTIWAARQTGKTWLMRRAMDEIRKRHGDRFHVATLSIQDIVFSDTDPPGEFLARVPDLFRIWLGLTIPAPTTYTGFGDLFRKSNALFDRPLILLIDEFDRLPSPVIDAVVSQFRALYLNHEGVVLHGLALIGVRAPFNVQRGLHMPNLTQDEVVDMFQQFRQEHQQPIQPQVVSTLYDLVRGQPGLIGWFGELLTEKYNPVPPAPIDQRCWQRVYAAACQIEPNNTLLNLLSKAKAPYLSQVVQIFNRTDVPFSFGQDWCNYLYQNGIIDFEETPGTDGQPLYVCRFSSPFVQQRLFSDLSSAIFQRPGPGDVLPLDLLDDLDDVFTPQGIMTVPILSRYAAYLSRLSAAGAAPWKDQPLRKDLRPMEAVGHFHLYNWLSAALGKTCLVSPEFPTGNGTVHLVLRWEGHTSLIEVKSFTNLREMKAGQQQAAGYAERLKQSTATLAVFVPTRDEETLRKLSGPRVLGEVTVHTVALPFGG